MLNKLNAMRFQARGTAIMFFYVNVFIR